ncbi:MAG TPA: hypothetical protein VGM30_00520 [Puia sp.]|jgi:hypothetical protein
MKKMIGVAALLLTLILSVIYRQLTGAQAKTPRPKVSVPTVVQEVRENLFLASLAIQ